jgi:hypothetical protein
LEIDTLPQDACDRFAARTDFDPRVLATPYSWFRISPRRIQAWREANELSGRELMRDEGPDFRVAVASNREVRSDEAYVACAECARLIEANDREALVARGCSACGFG